MASFYYFFNSKFILICFWQFFFVKSSNNFFSIKIINNICQRHNVFNFLNQKHFFWPIWNVTFCKNIFTFWYSKKITNFKFKIFIVNVFTRINICTWFYINTFRFGCTMTCIVVFFFTIWYNLPIYKFFETEFTYL